MEDDFDTRISDFLDGVQPAPIDLRLAATGTDNARPTSQTDDATNGEGGHIWGQLGGEVLQNVASGDQSASNTTDEVDKAQVLTLSRKENRRQRLATTGESSGGRSRTYDTRIMIPLL